MFQDRKHAPPPGCRAPRNISEFNELLDHRHFQRQDGPYPSDDAGLPVNNQVVEPTQIESVPEFTGALNATEFAPPADISTRDDELRNGFSACPIAIGQGKPEIEIHLSVDETQYTHVRFSNLPQGATLNRGRMAGPGTFEVEVSELVGLTILPPANQETDFIVMATPVEGDAIYQQLAQTINVLTTANVNPNSFKIEEFAIVLGHSGRLPIHFDPEKFVGKADRRLVLRGLPEFISLSAGQRTGNQWEVRFDELDSLRICAKPIDDTSGWCDYYLDYRYKLFNISYWMKGAELVGPAEVEEPANFMFYAFEARS